MKLTWFSFIVYGLSTYRLVRLIATDSVFEKVRQYFYARGYRLMQRRSTFGNSVEEEKVVPKKNIHFVIHELITCRWCLSVWAGGGVVSLLHYQGSWFRYVAYALAFSAFTGLLSQVEHD